MEKENQVTVYITKSNENIVVLMKRPDWNTLIKTYEIDKIDRLQMTWNWSGVFSKVRRGQLWQGTLSTEKPVRRNFAGVLYAALATGMDRAALMTYEHDFRQESEVNLSILRQDIDWCKLSEGTDIEKNKATAMSLYLGRVIEEHDVWGNQTCASVADIIRWSGMEEGHELWSPLAGKLKYIGLDDKCGTPIIHCQRLKSDDNLEFDKNGHMIMPYGVSEEKMLYPTKRDSWEVYQGRLYEELPQSWGDWFKESMGKDKSYIDDNGHVYSTTIQEDYEPQNNMNLLDEAGDCDQHLALMKLHVLRNAWREGWTPDDTEEMWSIDRDVDGHLEVKKGLGRFLSFQDRPRAVLFLGHFRNLLEQAGDLV